ncbi:hypothetical protein OG455_01550 [Kitasatospora sp. NBC_01287]|uniref:hypothetical protein n=1 Tax=Kitasatospora sp. NBC_01287 TaxID=2903573 RepID=UPI0022557F70|nr:hypothetical protein [Kitasatospora sp. NBC_01287]MCX4744210.1 hypothetical protein [Kitasatospora sp. NBC_01287]
MSPDEQQDHASVPERPRPTSPATPDESALPVPKGRMTTRGEPLVGEATRSGPIIVVTAIALKRPAREALAERLGPGHIVLDIRRAGPDADIVLVPPASAQLLGVLRRQFPQARMLATEFTDDDYGADFRGPISRILASDIDGYFMAPTIDDLARVTQSAGRAVAGALSSGTGDGRRRPVDFLEANRRLLLGSGGGADPDAAGEQAQGGGVTIDLDAWARALDGDARILVDLAWPLILQFLRQGVRVTVVGDPPEAWSDRASAAGVRICRSPRQLPDAASDSLCAAVL